MTHLKQIQAAFLVQWVGRLFQAQALDKWSHIPTVPKFGLEIDEHIIIIMYIYHALINSQSGHMIHINLNMIFYTHLEHSPTKTIYISIIKDKI